MLRKRILFLGGAYAQIPIIREAKNRNMYVITCDYFPENPGHKLADEYFNVSTTDLNGVLKLAEKVKPDYVVAYASDPAAPTAAYVSEKLGLPGNSYHSILNLAHKHIFRNLLKSNGFNTPRFEVISQDEKVLEKLRGMYYPLIIKPIDSSGSKGISRINYPDQSLQAIRDAMIFSREKKVIAEEYIDNQIADIHGDGFVVNGKLVFTCLGDHIYNGTVNPFNPKGTLWPTKLESKKVNEIVEHVSQIIKLSGFLNGPVNIEARINIKGEPFVMEIGPRSGGHFVPQAIELATGFNMVKAILDVLLGKNIEIPNYMVKPVAYYAVHSNFTGFLQSIQIDNEIKPFIWEFHQYIQPGEKVNSFTGANAAIGIIVFLFNERKEMDYYLSDIERFINVSVLASK
ncbi:MAG TPA: ATP-grasp domain-containing protein [Prolixibacteraceae bacterium]|jgi:biotin carboxylase|nr:ATP-grasp domain-containing protein [Prolixibacteraceae bacterium]HOS89690.1 ATP-grasp domain-containing protein [Prolixibacteraceae bacterium]HPL44692.1 ATP-grasp domain-containing protein [Prolixibacteraceae bacterium]HQE51389.1 ATP-grasp domain-containing protein [Prolixibacteraceae bacterium]HQH75750.1 ATP-grasp domain-containing protein [Prolixibacteraceae bacterium]